MSLRDSILEQTVVVLTLKKFIKIDVHILINLRTPLEYYSKLTKTDVNAYQGSLDTIVELLHDEDVGSCGQQTD